MISGLERRNSLRQGRHRPKQGELCSESASSAGQQQSRLERRRLPPCPFSVPLPMFSNAAIARPEARKQCTCEALICMSCHKQVQRWKCAGVARESLHTLPNIPKSTLPDCRRSPLSSLASNRRSITGFCNNPCYTSVAGLCADASLGTAYAQTSHDCQGLVCV